MVVGPLPNATRRVKVYTGLSCNARCRFCYYWDRLNTNDPTTVDMLVKLNYAKGLGIEAVDFSGGEPTIRRDIVKLVRYAKRRLGFKTICVITNGIKLADKTFLRKLIDQGLNDILFSIEGPNPKIHDYLTQISGSFNCIDKAIRYAKDLSIRVRTNTTVTSFNYMYLPDLADYLAKIKPNAVNFILFNDWCSAYKVIREMSCKYSAAAPYLREAISKLINRVKKITIRYIPFCFLPEYEHLICNLLQKKYDHDEWNDYVKEVLSGKLKVSDIKFAKIRLYRFVLRNIIDYPFVLKNPNTSMIDVAHDIVIEKMRRGYVKRPDCIECKYYSICDGLEKSYAKVVGLDELHPIKGEVDFQRIFSIR